MTEDEYIAKLKRLSEALRAAAHDRAFALQLRRNEDFDALRVSVRAREQEARFWQMVDEFGERLEH